MRQAIFLAALKMISKAWQLPTIPNKQVKPSQ